MRKYYLDNLRWPIVLSVLPCHVFYVSNKGGIYGAIPGMPHNPVINFFTLVLYNSWAMVLLCLIAGMSAKYALQKRSGRRFFENRVDKLLIPGTLGCLVYQWLSGYLYAYVLDPATLQGLSLTDLFMKYVKFAFLDSVSLWVSQVLFVCCCALLLIRKLDKNDKLWNLCGKFNLGGLILLFVPIWIFTSLLDIRISAYALFRYRLGTNLAAFLIGYYILSHETIQERLAKRSRLLSFVAILSTVVVAVFAIVTSDKIDSTAFNRQILVVWYLWVMILAVIGFARKRLNKETAFTRYMSKVSYGLLIVHYPVMLLLCIVIPPIGLPTIPTLSLIIVLEFILSFVVYELLKRVPIIRYCVFGYRKEQTREALTGTKT